MKNCFHQYGHQYCNDHYRKNAIAFKVTISIYYYYFFFFGLNLITPCDIKEYCIVGLKTIYSNFKVFIFQLICITFESVGFFFFFFFFMQISMLYSGEQILSFKLCLVFYTGDSLNIFFFLLCNRKCGKKV